MQFTIYREQQQHRKGSQKAFRGILIKERTGTIEYYFNWPTNESPYFIQYGINLRHNHLRITMKKSTGNIFFRKLTIPSDRQRNLKYIEYHLQNKLIKEFF